MREFFGMVLGCALTILIVYLHDSGIGTGTATEPAQATRQIVNWDVAADDWNALKTRAHDDWVRISSK